MKVIKMSSKKKTKINNDQLSKELYSHIVIKEANNICQNN